MRRPIYSATACNLINKKEKIKESKHRKTSKTFFRKQKIDFDVPTAHLYVLSHAHLINVLPEQVAQEGPADKAGDEHDGHLQPEQVPGNVEVAPGKQFFKNCTICITFSCKLSSLMTTFCDF